MSSQALIHWRKSGEQALDQMESAIRSLGGTGRGRRWATQHLNESYCLMISSQFQAFCRNLHDECIDRVIRAAPPLMTDLLRRNLDYNRELDHRNPTPGTIGKDFNRLGLDFWGEVKQKDSRSETRRTSLAELNAWRNAIAHQDFDPAQFPNPRLRLRSVRKWRSACSGLATTFDEVMADQLTRIVGTRPW